MFFCKHPAYKYKYNIMPSDCNKNVYTVFMQKIAKNGGAAAFIIYTPKNGVRLTKNVILTSETVGAVRVFRVSRCIINQV